MPLTLVDVGAAPNDGTGDLNRDAWIKTNNNFEYHENRINASVPLEQKGQPGGVASLDVNTGKVPDAQLPDSVFDVIEVNTNADLPAQGNPATIYIVLTDNSGLLNVQYRWNGSAYVQRTTDNVPEGTTNLYFTEARVAPLVANRLRIYAPGTQPSNDQGPVYITGSGPAEFDSTLNIYVPLVRFAECRLDGGTAANSVKLSPVGPGRFTIRDRTLVIPANGIEVVPAGLTVGTIYYVYAYNNSGAIALEFSTQPHSTYAGSEVKSGDPTRFLVGMCRPRGDGTIVDNSDGRCVASWYNRHLKSLVLVGQATTSSTSDIALIGGNILRWGGRMLHGVMSMRGTFTGATIGSLFATLTNSGATITVNQIIMTPYQTGYWETGASPWYDTGAADGILGPTISIRVSAGTATMVAYFEGATEL